MTIGALFAACMTATFYEVGAIKCYVCQSNVDPKCADPFDNLTLPITDCDAYPRADLAQKSNAAAKEERGFLGFFGGGGSSSAPERPLRATLCRKMRQKANGQWRTIRSCGYLPAEKGGDSAASDDPNETPSPAAQTCEIHHGSYDVFVETCACNNKDGCNAATHIASHSSMLLVMSMVSVACVAMFRF